MQLRHGAKVGRIFRSHSINLLTSAAWNHADVMTVADIDVLRLITLTMSAMVFTALVGIFGLFLNSRPFLAAYIILLCFGLLSLVMVGYASYRKVAFSLDHKLDMAWSQSYTTYGRLLIQDSLQCCGYYSPLHEATFSKQCYTRSPLPGCKEKLYRFELENLETIWSVAFSLALLHLINLLAALLCANHLTRTFGNNLMPKHYRLTGGDVRDEAERILRGVSGVSGPADEFQHASEAKLSSTGWFMQDEEKMRLLS